MLCNENCHIKHFAILRILSYLGPVAFSESCLFRHIQAYSGIFNNDSYNNINFLLFTLILHSFQPNLKRRIFFYYDDVSLNARLSLLK